MLLNLDAGELASETEALWSMFDVLCCACGGHAGDAASMARVARFCASGRPRLGAHPAYPDRMGFGRRSIAMPTGQLEVEVATQCRALAAAAGEVHIAAVKPHGALYHDAVREAAIAAAVVRGATTALGTEITIIGPPRGALAVAARTHGIAYAREGFADRRTNADGTLVARSEPDALIEDPRAAAAQAVALAGEVDTICIHGDTPNALAIARAVRDALRGRA